MVRPFRRASGAKLVVAAALALSAGACADSTDTTSATGGAAAQGPIRVGSVSTLSGRAVFPEASQAARAVFEQVNAEGGIGGRRIEYLVEDDKFDPAAAAQAARRLVDDRGVVALVGSASPLECSVNAAYYAQRRVLAVQGTGIDTRCFSSPNISPVNAGPFVGLLGALEFAGEELGAQEICLVTNANPAQDAGYDAALERWRAQTGRRLAYVDRTADPTRDPTPQLLAARRAGCDALVHTGVDVQARAVMNARRTQRLDFDVIMLTAVYTEQAAEALGPAGDGLHAIAEFEPFTGAGEGVAEWRALMERAGVPLNSFAEGGYVAASAFVEALRAIRGEVTRASVTQALRDLGEHRSPLMGTPYAFAEAPAHNPNRAVKVVRLQDGAWETVSEDWLRPDVASDWLAAGAR